MWTVKWRLSCAEHGTIYENECRYAFCNAAVAYFRHHRLQCWKRVSIAQVTTGEVAAETTERCADFTWHFKPEAIVKQPHHDNLDEHYD